LIAALETNYKVSVITQNIDDLHERAGSRTIYHLHGLITKKRTTGNSTKFYAYDKDIQLGELGEDNTQFRPHIVWFGEAVPMMDKAISVVQTADIFIVIGTSLKVYPAAGLMHYIPGNILIYVIDKQIPANLTGNIIPIEKNATNGMQELFGILNG
jgi:NAD-dependent deacetylase